jgi:hypothetical protein
MSGGRFNYKQYELQYIADEIQQCIITNHDDNVDDWGTPIGRHYNEDTIAQLRKAVQYLKLAQLYAHRVDYLLSGDDGEEAFHKRIAQELEELKL